MVGRLGNSYSFISRRSVGCDAFENASYDGVWKTVVEIRSLSVVVGTFWVGNMSNGQLQH